LPEDSYTACLEAEIRKGKRENGKGKRENGSAAAAAAAVHGDRIRKAGHLLAYEI